MKKVITLFFICIGLTMLDNTLSTFIAIKSIYPSILFVFIISYSIINGPVEAIILGIFAGALQDIYLFNGLGINMLSNMLTCYIAAQIGKSIFKEKSFVPIISTFFLSILKGVMMFSLFYLLKIKVNIQTALYVSIYNMILSIILYRYVYKLSETKFMKKDWRF
ncbi:rod shape-determining protein MreD [Clostridium sp. Marseille-Q7071]